MKIATASLTVCSAAVLAGNFLVPSAAFADSLKERQAKVTGVINKTRAAVVALQSRSPDGQGIGSGSGVIVSPDGLILTAAHVVDAAAGKGGSGEVVVVLQDGRQVKGKVLGRDRGRDAAMVQIEEGKDWPYASMAADGSVEKGEWCIAMGHPGGYDPQRGAPVRMGRLWLDNDKAFYRSDCTVSGGDSGGPLFDLDGNVIGIHSSISMNLTENRHVPVTVFRQDWERLKKGETWGDSRRVLSESNDLTPNEKEKEKPERKQARRLPKPELKVPEGFEEPLEPQQPAGPAKGSVWLGLKLGGTSEGVEVGEVVDGSPAAKAGIKTDDVIVKVDGREVGGTGDVLSRVRASSAGDKLKFTVLRDGKEQEIEVILANRE